MDMHILWGLVAFSLVSSITPGPNNLMLMASGANYGFQRSIPHMLGVAIGFVFMVMMVGMGLMQLFDALPASYSVLKVLSVTYLIYLAVRIATASPSSSAEPAQGRPLNFGQAAAFQWVNPKAWTMALTAISVYAPTRDLGAVLLVAAVFGLVNLPSVSLWTVLGYQLQRVLAQPRRLRAFNVVMAILLVGSLYPVLEL
nr:LysE family translocator [Oceanococcus sp. HetDA_MAG_MS8]